MRKHERRSPSFDVVLEQLRETSASLPFGGLDALSSLDSHQMAALRPVLAGMPVEKRRLLIETLAETNETDFEHDFDQVMVVALDDADPQVRAAALDGLMYDVAVPVIERVRQMAEADTSVEVRAKAVSKLGHFILLGEYEEIPERISLQVQETALALYRRADEPLDVRRRALEAVSNCGRDEVADMIRESYQSSDLLMRVSAVFAMGRSYDDVWAPHVMQELQSPHPELRYEAARAAGDLELEDAVPYLAEFARGEDREIQLVAVWALGEIGGDSAGVILTQVGQHAEAHGDDDLLDAVDEAQATLMMMQGDERLMFEALDGLLPMGLDDFFDHTHDDDDEEGDDDDDDEDEGLIEDEDEEFDHDFGELPGFRTFSIEEALDESLDDEDDVDLDDLEDLEDDDQN